MVTAVDLYTGQPATTTGVNNRDFIETSVKGPQTTRTSSNTTQEQRSNQTSVSSSYQLNTTPEILEILNQFVQQMSDRPVVSMKEASAKFPKAVAKYVPYGAEAWVYIDPTTGRQMSNAEAQKFNAEQDAKAQQLMQSSGVIRGGTADQRAVSDARLLEIDRNRETQGKYSKEAAFADAKMLGDYFTRILTEQQMPGILRAAEGSGASQGSTRALLTEQAIARNAESASKTGLDAAAAYGQINNQLAGVLEALTRQDPNSISNQLLNAINASKGIVQAGSQIQNVSGTTKTTTSQNQVQNAGEVATVGTRDYIDPVSTITRPEDGLVASYQPSSLAGTGSVQADTMSRDPAQSSASPVRYSEDNNNLFFE